MATTADPWGQTPLTAEGLADHPLSLRDFNRDATGYWRIIRGQKDYPREWFDATGTYTGTGTQPGDRAGQDQGFFHTGERFNWETGQWENPTNWANVIGLAAAGGVGAGIAAPLIGAALGGGAAGPLAGGYGAATTASPAAPSALAAGGGGGVMSTLGTILGSGTGPYGWLGPVVSSSLNLVGTEKQVNASEAAAQKQLEATQYAADAQAKAAAEALAFQRQQAAYDAAMAESTRSANYDQWAAKQAQLGSVGQALGLPARAIPAYVPLPPSGLGSGAPAAPPAAPMPAPAPATTDATPAAAPGGEAAAWWNPQDPRGSVTALFAGTPPTSQAILDRKAQIEAAGGQVSPANQEGVTSKIYLPGVGWTRVLEGGVKGGQGTGWTYVPQPGGGGGAVPTQGRQGQPAYAMSDPLGSVQQYFLDPTQARGTLKLPTGRLGSVASYF